MTDLIDFHIYTDGGSRGNPGEAAYGFVIKTADGKVLAEVGKRIGINTNNVAEYSAVVSALEWIKHHKQSPSSLSLFLDSELIARQLSGIYRVKHEGLKPLYNKIIQFIQEFGVPFTATHIPREKNHEADTMVNRALDNKL